MLSTLIVGSDQRLVNYLRQMCAEFASIWIYKTLPIGARLPEIASALSHYSPDIVFLVVSEADAEGVETVFDGLQDLLLMHLETSLLPVVGGTEERARSLFGGKWAGPVLTHPFNGEEFERALLAAMERRRADGTHRGELIAFLPSKAGAGATTLAANLAGMIANQFDRKTLLLEADLRSGAIPFLLGLSANRLSDVGVGDPNLLTDAGWKQAIYPSCGMDVLPANVTPQSVHGSRWDYYRLLRYARTRYDAVLVDLGDVVDEVAESVVAEADQVYIVANSDTSSLRLIGRRLWNLQQGGVRVSHIQFLLNRLAKGDPAPDQLEKVACQRFAAQFPEDARGVKEAMRTNRLVAAKSPLGRALSAFGSTILGPAENVRPRRKSPAFAGLKELMSHALGH